MCHIKFITCLFSKEHGQELSPKKRRKKQTANKKNDTRKNIDPNNDR